MLPKFCQKLTKKWDILFLWPCCLYPLSNIDAFRNRAIQIFLHLPDYKTKYFFRVPKDPPISSMSSLRCYIEMKRCRHSHSPSSVTMVAGPSQLILFHNHHEVADAAHSKLHELRHKSSTIYSHQHQYSANIMAKSLRSKTKRSFRNKKREEGIYAATEAARLNRLNEKLVAAAKKDKDGDVPIDDAKEGHESLGLCSLLIFGLLDQNDITAEGMEAVAKQCPGQCEDCHLQSLVGDLGVSRFHIPSETIREPLKEKNDSDLHADALIFNCYSSYGCW